MTAVEPATDLGRPEHASAFISYSRVDASAVRRLHAALESRGRDAWVDWADIYPSAEWWEEIRQAIQAADAIVFAISPESVASRVCLREVDEAVAAGKRLVPVVLRHVPSAEVPEPLRRHHWISFQAEEEWEGSVDRLIEALEADFDWMRDHTLLLGRATEWDGRGRDPSRLLRGRALELAEGWIARATEHAEPRPTPIQADYILASRKASTRGQRRLLAGLGVIAVAILGLAAVALVQRGVAEEQRANAVVEARNAAIARDAEATQRLAAEERSRVARSRELAASAERQLALDPELGLLLALEATDVARTEEAGTALRDAIEASRVREILPTPPGSQVSQLVWDRGGRWIAALHVGGTVSVWDRSAGGVRTFAEGLEGTKAVEIGAGGVLLATGTSIVAVSLETGEIEALAPPWPTDPGAEGADPVIVGWNESMSRVLVRSGTRLALLEAPSLEVVARLEAPPETSGARLSPDARLVALWADERIELRRIGGTTTPVSTIEVGERVSDLEFSSDSGRVLATTTPGNAGEWDAETGEFLGELEGGAGRNSSDLVVAGTGGHVGAGTVEPFRGGVLGFDTGGRVRVWSVETGRIVSILGSSSQPVELHSFMPEGERVVTTGTSAVQIWDLRTSVELAALRGQLGSTVAMAISPDGREIVTADQLGRVRVWDATTDEASERFGRFPLLEDQPNTSWPILSMQQTADGRLLAFSVAALKAITWDWTEDGFNEIAEGRPIGALALSPDGATLATAEQLGPGDGATGTMLRRWRVGSGVAPRVCRLADATSGPTDIAFSPDGTRLAIATGDAWRIVGPGDDCPTERAVSAEGRFRALAVSFDPTGTVLYSTGRPGHVEAWDVASGEPIWSIEGHQFGAIDIAISPDGAMLATAGLDDVVRVWKASDGSPVHELRGHADQVHGVAFSPDGAWLASGSADRTALVWDVASGRLLDRLSGNTDEVQHVAMGHDGRIATGGWDGYLRVFECRLCIADEALAELGRSRVTRELSPEERRAFLGEAGQ